MPLSIPPIIGSELCERWAYYSVRAVLVLFLTSRLGYSDDGAVATYSYWVAASYLSPFLGGYLADARTGRFATIVIFSAIYLVGMCALAASAAGAAASAGGVLAGLALSALGTGGIKPCVSAFGVDQLLLAPGAAAAAGAGGAAAGATLVSRYFLLFYFSINAGSTLSFIVTPLVRVAAGFDAAFWLSAAVLALALAFFLAGTPLYVRLPPGGRSVYASFARVFAASWRAGCGRAGAGGGAGAGADGYRESAPLMPAAAAATAPAAAADYLASAAAISGRPALTTGAAWADAALASVPAAEVFGVAAVVRLLPPLLCLCMFWALFDAQSSIWTLQRTDMRTLCFAGGNACMTTEQLGVLNPLLVLVFVPVIGWLTEVMRARVARGAAPAWLEPTPLRRMAAGMLLTPLAFVLTAIVQAAVDAAPANSVSILWQVPQFVVITIAEVLVSATGLEWANKEAPAAFTTSVVALYLGTVALGNVITGVLYSALSGVLSSLQLIILLTALMAAAAALFCVLAARYVSLPMPPADGSCEGESAQDAAKAHPAHTHAAKLLDEDPAH